MKQLSIIVLLFTLLGFCTEQTSAQETSIMVRVQSKDAKFIGSSIGGAYITIRNENSGKVLAEGTTSGSTGNTDIIMKKPIVRGQRLTDDSTAGFLAKLNIDEPVFVTIEAIAPINKKHASVRSTTQLWLIPGKDIIGEGVILEVPGFVVDILAPQTHETINAEKEVEIIANVVMMCGCPITENGIWDANKYEITAMISQEDGNQQTLPLKSTLKSSTFSGKVTLVPGNYEITVYAFDPVEGNTGVDKTNIIIK